MSKEISPSKLHAEIQSSGTSGKKIIEYNRQFGLHLQHVPEKCPIVISAEKKARDELMRHSLKQRVLTKVKKPPSRAQEAVSSSFRNKLKSKMRSSTFLSGEKNPQSCRKASNSVLSDSIQPPHATSKYIGKKKVSMGAYSRGVGLLPTRQVKKMDQFS